MTPKQLPSRNRPPAQQTSRLSRRDFLATAATAAMAAPLIVPRHVLGGAGAVPPNSKTTLACIGVGGQGTQNLMTFLEFPEIQVVAVCDVDRESGGFLSWNWSQGKERQTCGREPARRTVDAYYAQQRPSGKYGGCKAYKSLHRLPRVA